MRGALIEAIERAPIRALVLYFWKKPRAILAVLQDVFFGAGSLNWLWCLLIGAICGSFLFVCVR